MQKFFYERNDKLLNDSTNKTFDEVYNMSNDEFRQWFWDFRKVVTKIWDEDGIPPRVGFNEEDIVSQFRDMNGFPVNEFEVVDELTGEKDVVRNTSVIGNAANQWFPTMMKTRINYSKNDDGLSIYDHFANDELFEKTLKYSFRHFKRDSFYHYSAPIKKGQVVEIGTLRHIVKDAETFVTWFEENARVYGTHDYWIEQKKSDDGYTGYNDKLKDTKWIKIDSDTIKSLVPKGCIRNIDESNMSGTYQIRLYEKGQKLFPIGLKAFRVSWCQYAVNFPPLTAKYLYEKFTKHVKNQDQIVVYDPSSGWGGRILGAMSTRTRIPLHYVGTDPNTDHTIVKNGKTTTKYADLAEFYNRVTNEGVLIEESQSFEVFQLGSEVIRNEPGFKKYKGKVDMVFTSPPYFAKEAYSEDPEQSYKKFSSYETWRDGFLRPTLETAVEWLRSDRYLLWNIADAKFGNDMLPLEGDSNEILKSLGMQYKGKLKMSLAQMPGGNRVDPETGLPKAKNFCKVNGIWLKYEPVFIWYKP